MNNTEKERHQRVLANPLMVLDTRDGKVKVICRDGYYPSEILSKLRILAGPKPLPNSK